MTDMPGGRARTRELNDYEAERQERRATNLIWNAANDYGLHPDSRAYDADGYADVYMNSIVGAVYKYYDYPVIRKLLDGLENAPQGDAYADLFWTGLENCAYQRGSGRAAGPAAAQTGLRAVGGAPGGGLERAGPAGDRQAKAGALQPRAGRGRPLIAREERILSDVEFPPELSSEQIVERMRRVLAEYFGVTGGMLRREALGKLPQFMGSWGRKKYSLGARVRSGDVKKREKAGKPGALARIGGEKSRNS